jgi:hypothetical protein
MFGSQKLGRWQIGEAYDVRRFGSLAAGAAFGQ